MAIFPGPAENAVNAAVEMMKQVSEYNTDSQKHDDPIAVGIGHVMLGTIGEAERMDGTVIADAVNLASRLEGLTKRYGASILISEVTLSKISQPESYHSRSLGKFRVKGKCEAVSVFEIYDADPDQAKMLKTNAGPDLNKAWTTILQKNLQKQLCILQKC